MVQLVVSGLIGLGGGILSGIFGIGGGLVIVLERMATRLAVGAAPARAARKPVP